MTRRSAGRGALLVGVWMIAALSDAASGQSPQDQRFTSSASTTLVEVVTFVSDRNGRPVDGLTRSDFELDEDGTPQQITHFNFVALPRRSDTVAAAGPTAPTTPTDVAGNDTRTGRSYVLVLDALHVDPLRTGRVKELARRFIDDFVEPGDSVAVVTPGGAGTQSFTSDKSRLLRAIDLFVGSKSRSATLNRLEMSMRASTDDPAQDYENATKASNARTLFDSLRMISRSFGSVPGRRKSIVLFSEGIELDMTDMLGPSVTNGAAGNASSRASTYAADLLTAQRAMYDDARRSNVSLYTVDPRGTSIGDDDLMRAVGPAVGQRGTSGAPPPTRDVQREVGRSQGVLRNFADETGGFALVNSSDFARGFNRIVDANSAYYVLGYSPSNSTNDGRYRKISVRVARPDVAVSARPGYFAMNADPAATPAPASGLKLEGASAWMQALLVSPLPISGLGMQVVGTPIGLRDAARDPLVAIVVELQTSGFRFQEEGDQLRNDIEVGFIAVDAEGKVQAGRASTGTLRLPKDGRTALAGGLRYVLEVPLPSQRYQVRVGAVESGGGTAGSAVLDLDLTDSSNRTVPAGIVVGVHGDQVPTTGQSPVMRALLPVSPTATRQFYTDQRLAVYVPLQQTSRERKVPAEVVLVVRRVDGTVVRRTAPVPAASGNQSGTSTHGAAFDLPLAELAPGLYTLGAEVVGDTGREGLAPISFAIVSRG